LSLYFYSKEPKTRRFPVNFPVSRKLSLRDRFFSTASATTQPLQTARFRYDAKLGVPAGISGHSTHGFSSLRAFARLNDGFWRFVSASKNSVPASYSSARSRTAPDPEEFRF
jgi:hypothetical protein